MLWSASNSLCSTTRRCENRQIKNGLKLFNYLGGITFRLSYNACCFGDRCRFPKSRLSLDIGFWSDDEDIDLKLELFYESENSDLFNISGMNFMHENNITWNMITAAERPAAYFKEAFRKTIHLQIVIYPTLLLLTHTYTPPPTQTHRRLISNIADKTKVI